MSRVSPASGSGAAPSSATGSSGITGGSRVSTGDSVPFFERLAIPSSFSPASGERLSDVFSQDLDAFTGFGGDEQERAEISLHLLSRSGPVRLTQPVGFRRDDD